MDYKPVVITAVTKEGTLYGQYCSDGPALEQLMEKLRAEFASKPPLGGAYTPKKGAWGLTVSSFYLLDICAVILKFLKGMKE